MKDNKGFTLIELIVGMAIMAIIFGGIVAIFGVTSTAARTGMNQQQAYEDARNTMNFLRTTIHYGSGFNVDPSNTTTTLTYTSTLKKDALNATDDDSKNATSTYKIAIALENGKNPDNTTSWSSTSGKKQLVIYYNNSDKDHSSDAVADPVPGTDTPKIRYPKYEANSALIAAGTYTGNVNAYESGFPIIKVSEASSVYGQSVELYKILLPLVYKAGNENKTDTLMGSIAPTNLLYEGGTDSGGGTTETTPEALTNKAKTIAKFIGEMAGTTVKNKKGDLLRLANGNYGYQIASGAFFKNAGTAGLTENVYNFTDSSGKKLQDASYGVGDTAWVLITLADNKGSLRTKTDGTIPVGYRLYIAKNVINDTKTVTGEYARTSDEELLTDAKKGIYVIRPFYSFITYYYDFNMDGELISEGVRGYASCSDTVGKDVNDGENKHYFNINYASWQVASADSSHGYQNVKDSSSKSECNHNIYLSDDLTKANNNTWSNSSYIEDTYATTNSPATYRRIDYDGSGAEYTAGTCAAAGTNYSYPPNGTTGTTQY